MAAEAAELVPADWAILEVEEVAVLPRRTWASRDRCSCSAMRGTAGYVRQRDLDEEQRHQAWGSWRSGRHHWAARMCPLAAAAMCPAAFDVVAEDRQM